jgi:hypothetical protein
MNICSNPQFIQEIELTECIGLSLPKINSNFSLLEDSACANSNALEIISSTYETLSTQVDALTSLLPNFAKNSFYYAVINNGETIVNKGSFLKGYSNDSTGVFTLSFLNNFSNTDYIVIGTAATGTQTDSPSALTVTPIIITNEKVTINIGKINNTTINSSTTLMNPDYLAITIY